MSQTTARRLSWAPVLPYIDRHARMNPDEQGVNVCGRSWALADLLDINRRSARRLLAEPGIHEHAADALAARLGAHPVNLWPDEWASDLEETHA